MTKTVKVPSLNSGRKLAPKVLASQTLSTVSTSAAVTVSLRNRTASSSVGR